MPPSRKRKEPLAENDDTAPKTEREDPASTGNSTGNSNSNSTG
eukprot:CAMPEP_0172402402 /NCGR_PEP_ID=MMETSP1061-20121228/54287_1 /TAXON_ID=37318 /ORGANISM="Pseudo-nitzschia pungens, Strain cf. pungens" /LENGTH=42 /DNA_ID= /DNA_START= /DNA_END= /DNA_ORIENTATION=